ncbi:MAG: hypothetical protein B6244_12660 [Candidatus Cloacimonetes bacterium 4572_55]|nr:MAG: hypothetical protein B6244_12660 [Candidatus Cloacimonetes bacterium 4572_55]
MADRRLLYTSMIISIIIHLIFSIFALLITVMMTPDIPEFIDMTFGQPQTVRSISKPSPVLETPLPHVAAASNPIPDQPKVDRNPPPKVKSEIPPQPKPQDKPAPAKVESNPVKVTVPEASPTQLEESVAMPSKPNPKFERPTTRHSATDHTGLLSDDEKTIPSVADSENYPSYTPSGDKQNDRSNDDSTGGGLVAATVGEKGGVDAPAMNDGRIGPPAPVGNTNLPIEIDVDVTGRRALNKNFPNISDQITREGFVKFTIVLAPDGTVEKIRLAKRGDPAVEAAGLESIKKWRFTPIEGGTSQEGTITIYSKLR